MSKENRPKPRYKPAGGRTDTWQDLAVLEGKTVDRIDYGVDEKVPGTHGGEILTIYFTDGTEFTIREGSNASLVEGLTDKMMRDLRVDMMFFIERDGKPLV